MALGSGLGVKEPPRGSETHVPREVNFSERFLRGKGQITPFGPPGCSYRLGVVTKPATRSRLPHRRAPRHPFPEGQATGGPQIAVERAPHLGT